MLQLDFLVFLAAVFALAGLVSGISGEPVGFLISAISLVMWGFLLWFNNQKEKRELAQAYAKREKQAKPAFYAECLENKIYACQTEKEIQKAKLIADKHKLHYSDISILYSEAKALHDKAAEAKEAAALESIKNAERLQYKKTAQFSRFSGRDKRIAMLTAEMEEANRSADGLWAVSKGIASASQQKEHDWAIHGGIASGIAGPAAGLAAATDIQAKNAQIRSQNEANLKYFSSSMTSTALASADQRLLADKLKAEIEEAKTKLVSEDSAETCLSKLSFSNTNISVSDTGTITVTTCAQLNSELKIFGDVCAVIDGTIIAKIYDADTYIGYASMVLPKYGIEKKASLSGMCLFCGKKENVDSYSITFSAYNLWAMER